MTLQDDRRTGSRPLAARGLLEARLDEFTVTELSFGCGYLAAGRVRSGAVSP